MCALLGEVGRRKLDKIAIASSIGRSLHRATAAILLVGPPFIGVAIAQSASAAIDAPLATIDEAPATTDLAPGDDVTNRLASQSPARRPRGRSIGNFLSSLFGSMPQVIGPAVSASEYPWQLALRISANGKAWRCGGILIAPQYVLTAAHCLDAADVSDRSIIRRVRSANIEVFHGSREYARGSLHPADPAWGPLINPGWKRTVVAPFAGDAALIRLVQPIQGPTIAPIQVSPTHGPKAVVSGWGRFDSSKQTSSVLRAVAVPLIDNATCTSHLPADRRNLVSDTSLCAESPNADSCKGDSGGPLVVGSRRSPQTIGIVSWGPSESCSLAGLNGMLIGGYTRASSIASWVHDVTGDSATQTSAPPEPLFNVIPIAVGGGVDR